MFFKIVAAGLLLTAMSLSALADTKGVYFVYPTEGATVPLKFKAQFGVHGMNIKPAGEAINDKTAGHFHIIIDGKPAAPGDVVPADSTHVHYGKGQTEGEITLTPGRHTLALQFADGLHRAYGSDLSYTIKVTAKK